MTLSSWILLKKQTYLFYNSCSGHDGLCSFYSLVCHCVHTGYYSFSHHIGLLFGLLSNWATKAESQWARHSQKAAKFTRTIKRLYWGKRRNWPCYSPCLVLLLYEITSEFRLCMWGVCLTQNAARRAALQLVRLCRQLENEKFTVRY